MELLITKSSIHTKSDFIMRALIPLNIGYIDTVSVVPVGANNAHIIVKFSKVYTTPNAIAVQKRFAAKKSINIVYDRERNRFWRATHLPHT
jgi:hypothetical protein